MTAKYYVDANGVYQGGWDVPDDAQPVHPFWKQIPAPPEHAADILLVDGTWDTSKRPAPAPTIADQVLQALQSAGAITPQQASAALAVVNAVPIQAAPAGPNS